MNAAKPTLPRFAKLPKTYAALCRLHLPRTLHDEIELDAVTEIIDLMAAHLDNIGMTATEWGRLIGIDRSTASLLLRGERKFNTSHVRKTAEALSLEASLLI
jgi:antitoxin component HigA of HigAB toxin-antitoxin module